jgi:hypothetical protein
MNEAVKMCKMADKLRNGLAEVKPNRKPGYINKRGNMVWEEK